jgi:hypothetical protein
VKSRSYVLESIFLCVVLGFLLFSQNTNPLRTFSLIFFGIILEALPFLLLGSLVGGLVEAFISQERLTSILPRRKIVAILVAAGMGIVFPVCECAIVPVVRRLVRKGLPMASAIAYLLAGPIVNPIVIGSTVVAYKFDWRMAIARALLGYGIAVIVALCMDRILGSRKVLIAEESENKAFINCSCSHCHDAETSGVHSDSRSVTLVNHSDHSSHSHHCSTNHHPESNSLVLAPDHQNGFSLLLSKTSAAIRHAVDEFLTVGPYFVMGVFVAAIAQTYIGREQFVSISSEPLVAIVLMMALAVLLNLCSEADAFIASSFRGTLPYSAQLAFLLLGPMLDLKLLLMYRTLFRKKVIVLLATSVAGLVLIFAACMHWGGILN